MRGSRGRSTSSEEDRKHTEELLSTTRKKSQIIPQRQQSDVSLPW